ncbi:4'-phosphopantetheinyl transferase superfamily protein [Allokutzneria sp. A3M-2-11 16]|uniref:4'-phosphopantetheinyl transferase family protein n=1 Tax=Allokutzneria sp. A3M-2-11 16 TaxID=2962043 RepID=UPI0020B78719|nr:4'-phosphopantetheinyl transferase superfamily protein [Allokutzneria sp. A3M-2-11 16]MCP3805311.1 4'-phosphopantetheinyl transferase superfamily protein [Allokutzneria sp. A3M-2-11 16]
MTGFEHLTGSARASPVSVAVWRVELDQPAEVTGAARAWLSPDELERAELFATPQGRDRYVVAHGALRDILARYLIRAPGELRFRRGMHGKPMLEGEELAFSLAHSGPYALVAVSRRAEVGVDVEVVTDRPEPLFFAGRFFTPAEFEDLRSSPLEERSRVFFEYWTRKESYLKAIGMGLDQPLETFQVLAGSGDRPVCDQGGNPLGWTARDLRPWAGVAGAVAVRGLSVVARCPTWRPEERT